MPNGERLAFLPLVSSDSRNCYADALQDVQHGRFQPALAKLESMLMIDTVTIGIDKGTLPSGLSYDKAVEKGLGIWHTALPDSPYQLATGAKRPMILVKFVRSMPAEGADLQGMVEAEHEFKWNGTQHACSISGTIYVVYRAEGRSLSQNEVAEVVAHELGHLLGLTDAPSPRGLMGPFIPGTPRMEPSSEEMSAVQQLRDAVRDEIDRIEDQL